MEPTSHTAPQALSGTSSSTHTHSGGSDHISHQPQPELDPCRHTYPGNASGHTSSHPLADTRENSLGSHIQEQSHWEEESGYSWLEDHESDTIDEESQQAIPVATVKQTQMMEAQDTAISTCRTVREKGYPNRWGAKIPIQPQWNLTLFQELLQGYPDKEIIQWMKYGWPIGRLPTMEDPMITFRNHKGATEYPKTLQKYIEKEKSHDAVIGPLKAIPFTRFVGISPLTTRPKKESQDRRILIDLSFPPGGSVNDGICKDNYLGYQVKLTFPKTDEFAERIFKLGQGAKLYKVDLQRYFRQLDLDPGDYSLVGYIVNGDLYFDKKVPMGVRTGPYIAQRVSSAIAWIVKQVEYYLLNYVDDFVGAELEERAQKAFSFLINLLRDLRAQTSPDKIVPPTTRLDFLGTTFDSEKMSMEVPKQKQEEILKELRSWEDRKTATRQEVESLIGKLQFAARCIRPGRILISRLLNWLKTCDRHRKNSIPEEAQKDIKWWKNYMKQYNGVSLIWLQDQPRPDQVMATDASLKGYGGISGGQVFRGNFPPEYQKKNIATLELLAVMIGLRIWGEKFKGTYFWILVDNEAVATILNTGASRDPELQDILREIIHIAATHQFVIKGKHIRGVTNRIPDWLSRWKQASARRAFRAYAREKSIKRKITKPNMLKLNNIW